MEGLSDRIDYNEGVMVSIANIKIFTEVVSPIVRDYRPT